MNFKSAFKEKEEAFLQFKFDFGHNYEKQKYHLLDFDRFCFERYPNERNLTEEIVMAWAVIKPTETSNGYSNRIVTIRQFGKFLTIKGEDAFILPSGLKGGDMPLMPYVFSKESLKTFFQFTDRIPKAYRSPVRHLVAPVMFRYMYCCGLRPSEARKLTKEDVNLQNGRIFIAESKHYKERIIYADEELMTLTEEYLHRLDLALPDSKVLFPCRKGNQLSYYVQQDMFDFCRDHSEIHAAGTKPPNLYSFRHSFATHRIYTWYKEGRDIGSVLPALSAYMGHTHYQHTLYYLHFLPELFTEMSGFDFEQFSGLLPEVEHE